MGSVEPGGEDAESTLNDVAERQAGCFTASQAPDAGYSHASQSNHKQAGNWLRVGSGVYRLAHCPAQVDVPDGGRRGQAGPCAPLGAVDWR